MSNPFAAIVTLYTLATERLRKEEEGATAVEYGLMVGLIALAIILVVTALGGQLQGLFQDVVDGLPGDDRTTTREGATVSGRLREERGASAVEFALVLPLLVLLVLGIVEFGRGFQVSGTLSAAAREGVRVMALQNNPAAARAAVRSAASSLDPAITNAQITITPATCPTGAGTTTVRLTIDYDLPLMTGLFGATFDLSGTGVMRCGG